MANEYSIIACEEVHGTAQESMDGDEISFSASVDLMCSYVNRWALVVDILTNRRPWPKAVLGGSGSLAMLPRQFSIRHGIDERATSSGQMLDYEVAIVSVTWSTKKRESEDSEGNLFTETLEPNVEFLTQPHSKFRWGSQTGPPILESEAPGKQVYSLALSRTTQGLTSVPGAVLTLIGRVNQAAYTSPLLGLTFAAGTLLFMPSSLTFTVNTDLEATIDLTTKFAYKPDGWNKFWRAESESYEEMFRSDTGDAHVNYPEGDFSTLLSVA